VKYGLYQEQIEALLRECGALSDPARKRIAQAWRAGEDKHRRAAWKVAAVKARVDPERWRVFRKAVDAGQPQVYGMTPPDHLDLISGPVRDALEAAILALVVRDLIGRVRFRRLYDPWAAGAPAA
jgi:hypothetical protein